MKYCYIVDIDGTLSDPTHRLHHLDKGDWDSFFEEMHLDKSKEHVTSIVKTLYKNEFSRKSGELIDIFIVSGRPDNYRVKTVNWLSANHIGYDALFMRPAGDKRADYIIKKEILDMIQNQMGYTVIGVIDDRPSVLKMWRENNIPVLAVDYHSAGEKNQCEPGVLTLMVGPSGAGKSYWLSEGSHYTQHILSSDQFREYMLGDMSDQSANDRVFEAIHSIAVERIIRGLPTVIDATNIKNRDRRAITDLMPLNCEIHYVVIDRPLDVKIKDGSWRNGVIMKTGKTLIEQHHETFHQNLKAILAGDDDPRVKVFDRRKKTDVS